jgi:hypothetical protein
MEPGDIVVDRTLPIDGALLGDVLLRLRRDAHGAIVQWTLGDHGTAEVDVNFTSDGSGWHASARVWPRRQFRVTNVGLRLTPVAGDAVELRVEARLDVADLLRALTDELAEELLWHAARAGVS